MQKQTYSSSEQTKKKMSCALKALMQQKPLDRIAILDITDRCGIRRQNFYYHFDDIYALLRWTFEQEALPLLYDAQTGLVRKDGLLQLFRYLDENREFCYMALISVERGRLRHFFEEDIYNMVSNTIRQICAEIGPFAGSREDLRIATRFCVLAVGALTESWLRGEIDRSPEELVRFLHTALSDQIQGATQRLSQTSSSNFHSCNTEKR